MQINNRIWLVLFCVLASSLVLADEVQPSVANNNQPIAQRVVAVNKMYRHHNFNFRDRYTQSRLINQIPRTALNLFKSKFNNQPQKLSISNNQLHSTNQMPPNTPPNQNASFNNELANNNQQGNNQVPLTNQFNNQPQTNWPAQAQMNNNLGQINKTISACPTCKQNIQNNLINTQQYGQRQMNNIQPQGNVSNKFPIKRNIAFGNRKKRRFR